MESESSPEVIPHCFFFSPNKHPSHPLTELLAASIFITLFREKKIREETICDVSPDHCQRWTRGRPIHSSWRTSVETRLASTLGVSALQMMRWGLCDACCESGEEPREMQILSPAKTDRCCP